MQYLRSCDAGAHSGQVIQADHLAGLETVALDPLDTHDLVSQQGRDDRIEMNAYLAGMEATRAIQAHLASVF